MQRNKIACNDIELDRCTQPTNYLFLYLFCLAKFLKAFVFLFKARFAENLVKLNDRQIAEVDASEPLGDSRLSSLTVTPLTPRF